MSKVNSIRDEISERLKESARIKEAIAESKVNEIESMINTILRAYKSDGKVVLFGNGGALLMLSILLVS